ncbi:MAG: hypothetical protein AB2L13_00760 [Spirochaetota bacterium]
MEVSGMRILLVSLLSIITFSNALAEQKAIIKQNNEYSGITKEIIYGSADNEYSRFSKVIQYYDNNNVVRKVELTISPQGVSKLGISSQINYYNLDDTYSKIEIYYSTACINETGIDSAIELFKNGEIDEISYIRNENVVYIDKFPSEDSAHFHPFKLLSYYGGMINDLHMDYLKRIPGDKKESYTIETKSTKNRSCVKYRNKIIDLDAYDKSLLSQWAHAYGIDMNMLFSHYNKKILVEENGKEYWIYWLSGHIDCLKNDMKMVVSYHFIGGFNDRAAFALIQHWP